MLVGDNMPSVTDWIMVFITTVYVVATIWICRANIKSATATREQLIESKRQFNETKRLSIMPYIQCEHVNNSTLNHNKLSLSLRTDVAREPDIIDAIIIKNIGNGTAKNIKYVWTNLDGSYNRGYFCVQALQSRETCGITIYFNADKSIENATVSIELQYQDLFGNCYLQRIEFVFDREDSTHLYPNKHITYAPIMIGKSSEADSSDKLGE